MNEALEKNFKTALRAEKIFAAAGAMLAAGSFLADIRWQGVLLGVVFCSLNLRSWSLILQAIESSRAANHPQPIRVAMGVTLKLFAFAGLLYALFHSSRETVIAAVAGIILYLFCGSFVLMLTYRNHQ